MAGAPALRRFAAEQLRLCVRRVMAASIGQTERRPEVGAATCDRRWADRGAPGREWRFAMLAENFGLDGVLVLVIVPAVLFAASVISKLARNLGSARSELARA